MIEYFDPNLVNWSRAQFALTAMYHWLFVPLTLGLSILCAIFETIYFKTGNPQWKKLTRFWMKLFGINFAIGVATGIILEFEFGANWANYAWMVGDIFGAPLAAEGIMAFFLEATFFAVMFFGWERVSSRFHLFSTWMVAAGSNLSALWILVANSWMQYPVGMRFNADMARFEMENFMEILFSPYAVGKFSHTTGSSFMVAALFVVSICSWYLLKGRHVTFARRSIVVASIFGLLASAYTIFSGDESAYTVAQVQPMKLAAFEGHYQGARGAEIVAAGIVNLQKEPGDEEPAFHLAVTIPKVLSLLAERSLDGFVPGIDDLVYGNHEEGIMGVREKMYRGSLALDDLARFKAAQKNGDSQSADAALEAFSQNSSYWGYGYLEDPVDAVPHVPTMFYSFHVMVVLGTLIPVIFGLFLFWALKNRLAEKRWLLLAGLPMFVLGIAASQAGWVVAELGRQPWAIQNILPVSIARTSISVSAVQGTFFVFLVLFTTLLFVEIRIMLKVIAAGPEELS